MIKALGMAVPSPWLWVLTGVVTLQVARVVVPIVVQEVVPVVVRTVLDVLSR